MTVRVVQVGIMLVLAWGALAFGAVYDWAYWPLIAGCVVIGIAGARVSAGSSVPSRTLVVTMAVFAVCVALQLIPVSPAILRRVTPMTIDVITQLDVAYATGLSTAHALSIQAAATGLGLIFVVTFFLLFVGLTRYLSVYGTRWLARGIAVMGLLLALVGIIQKPFFNGKIYGFWTPHNPGGESFGPFVNKNHFAGWMLMALPLTLGLLLGGVARSARSGETTARDRMLWLGSKDAGGLVMTGAAAVVMGLSLVMTMSRSGMLAMSVAVVLSGALLMRRVKGFSRRSAGLAYLFVFVFGIVAWVGADTIVARFTDANWAELDSRRGAWQDAWGIVTAFPWVGTGFNTYTFATLFYQHHMLTAHFAQAHNDYLQLLAEGGVLLAVPAVLLGLMFIREVWMRFREGHVSVSAWWIRTGAVVGLVAIALQEGADFSLQMPGNAALFTVLCAIAAHRVPLSRPPSIRQGPA